MPSDAAVEKEAAVGYLTDDGLRRLVATSRSACALRLDNARQVSSTGFAVIADLGRTLRGLSLKNCRQLNDDVLVQIVAGCPQLQELSLMGCKGLTDRSVASLSGLGRLRRLNLWQCVGWSAPALTAACQSWSELVQIELRFCKQVDDRLVQALVSHCDRLQMLGLAYCELVTDNTMEHLQNYGSALTWLNVRGCAMISGRMLAQFSQARPEASLLYDKSVTIDVHGQA